MPVIALIIGAFFLIGAVLFGVLRNGHKSNEVKATLASRKRSSPKARTGTGN